MLLDLILVLSLDLPLHPRYRNRNQRLSTLRRRTISVWLISAILLLLLPVHLIDDSTNFVSSIPFQWKRRRTRQSIQLTLSLKWFPAWPNNWKTIFLVCHRPPRKTSLRRWFDDSPFPILPTSLLLLLLPTWTSLDKPNLVEAFLHLYIRFITERRSTRWSPVNQFDQHDKHTYHSS